jgi:murein DD-endopeptidase MepM/ murein hydrolase activator NlpD
MRRARTLLALLTVTVLVAAGGPASAAGTTTTAKGNSTAQKQRKAQIATQISGLKGQIEEVSAEEADLLGRLDDVRSQRADLDGKVADLDRQINRVQSSVDVAEGKLNDVEADVVHSQLKLDAATTQELAARQELRNRAIDAYIHHPELSAAAIMIHAGSLREMAATSGYYKTLVSGQRTAVDRYAAFKDQTEALRQQVEQKRDAVKAQRDVVVGQQAQLESARHQQDKVRQQVVAQEQTQQSLLDQIQSRKAEFEAQVAALQSESDSIGRLLQGVQSGQLSAPSGHGVLAVPIPGAPVTSPYGMRVHPVFGTQRMHTGVDFGAPYGTPIHAAADGVVIAVGPYGGYGNATIVDHGNSLGTLYAHQSAMYVSVGQHVSRGQVIGAVGCTGYCTGPHLHFEVRVSGNPVDPMPYL